MVKFNYQGALDAGYSDQDIQDYLNQERSKEYKPEKSDDSFLSKITNNFSNFKSSLNDPYASTGVKKPETENGIDQKLLKNVPDFNFQGALDAGYTPQEVNEYLEENQPKRSMLEKAGRIGAQGLLGYAESRLLPYELGVAPLASKEAQNVPYREELGQELENLQLQKNSGQWSPEDEKHYQNIVEQLQDPRKSMENVQTMDVGVRSLAEKATGLDLHPEGALEKAANWIGYIKDPKKIMELGKIGLKPKEIIKAISPSGSELMRGLGAGASLELAEQGNFGPIGTMAAAIVGDLAGAGTAGLAKGAKRLVTNPKQTIAEITAKLTPKEKINLQKEIIKDFRDSGIQADVGTLTDSNLMKMTQSRLSQSSLTGKAFTEFKDNVTNEIKSEYKALAESLGEAKFATTHEAGETAKKWMEVVRQEDLGKTRKLYQNAEKSLKEGARVEVARLEHHINKLERKLKPGSVKSTEQQLVLNYLQKFKNDIVNGTASVKDLMNNKIGISDIINYEAQGGTKQLLKETNSELDRAIISHGKENPTFAKNYINANKKFSTHAKTFRNKTAEKIMRTEDPAQILNKMNSVQGIRSLEKILGNSSASKEVMDGLKRMKLDSAIGDNLIDSTTNQVKYGTFSKLLEKGKNKEVIKEILGSQAFKRLEKLQKNVGKLAEAEQKFYNASKSGTVAVDAAILSKGMSGVVSILSGNPWPLLKIAGGILGARKLSNLLTDPQFLKMLEDVILASEKGTQQGLINSVEQLRPYFLQALQEYNQE